MTSVTLHVYDLSHGMAKQLSPALLGKTIEGVWHTGVLVFGKEYFFGGGIQALAPELVVARYGMHPVQTVPLGETQVSQERFEQFLRDNSSRFTAQTYDLLRHNCNNFSDEVARFLVGSGIPQHILDLPNEALNTPFGAMLRPMLENMQREMNAVPTEQPFAIPFNNPSLGSPAVPSAVSSPPCASLSARKFKVSGSPALHLDDMVKRIVSINAQANSEDVSLLSDAEVVALQGLATFVAATPELKSAAEDVGRSLLWWQILQKLLARGRASSYLFPALGVFRVLLLLPTKPADAATEKNACFEAIVALTDAEPSPLTQTQHIVLLSVLLNAFANPGTCELALARSMRFLPFVFAGIANPTANQHIRVLSAQLIGNCCLALQMEEELVVTTIVCGAVETLDGISRQSPEVQTQQTQQQTVEGIIVGLGRLLRTFEGARSLSLELGLSEVLRRLSSTPSLTPVQPLLSEVMAMI